MIATATIKAKETVSRFFEENHDLKTLPSVLAEIIRITADLDPDINALEREISKDPVISSKILNQK